MGPCGNRMCAAYESDYETTKTLQHWQFQPIPSDSYIDLLPITDQTPISIQTPSFNHVTQAWLGKYVNRLFFALSGAVILSFLTRWIGAVCCTSLSGAAR